MGREMMKRKLAALAPQQVRLQINNQVKTISNKQTVLEAANNLFGENIPFNCRAGICGACEVKLVRGGQRGAPQREKACWTPVEEKMRVITLNNEMMHWRQATADEG